MIQYIHTKFIKCDGFTSVYFYIRWRREEKMLRKPNEKPTLEIGPLEKDFEKISSKSKETRWAKS